MIHTLSKLPFEKTDLEPYISAETIDYHYGKHHQGYVDKLNKLIQGTRFESMPLEQIILNSDGAIFQNAAQIWNHDFYWKSLDPKASKSSKDIVPDHLLMLINKSFEGLDAFKKKYLEAVTGAFGSGWVWLVLNKNVLELKTTSNAETPLTGGAIPLLVCDVWEHAYYIDYRNDRAKYAKAVIYHLLNWEFAAKNMGKAARAVA